MLIVVWFAQETKKFMKTILHTIDTTGPGGAETVFIDLATRLPQDQYRAVVVIRGKGWVYDELRRRGIEPVLLDCKGSFNISYLKGLCRIIRDEQVDVIQSHLLGANVYCSIAGMLTGRPVVATFHGEVDIGDRERFKRLKFGAIARGARHVIAVTDSLRDDIDARTPLSASKIRVIYNGINTQDFMLPAGDSLRRRYDWDKDCLVIGSLGNIRPAKGYDVLLRAARQIVDNNEQCRFVIAGEAKKDSALLKELLVLRKQLGLENYVRFLGFTDNAAQFLADIDIFLSSSVSEGLPLSAIQAMVAGAPIVATRCGGYEGLIDDGKTGLLVEVNNPDAIREAVEKLAASPDMRRDMAARAKQYAVARYDNAVMLDSYRRLYDG